MTNTLNVPAPTHAGWSVRDICCAVVGAVSLVLAVGAASTVNVPVDSDLGLVAVLPYPFWAAVLLLNIAFVVALRGDATGPARRPVMLWLVVVLVLVLFGTAAFITNVPRGEVAFRHLGIADALSGSGKIDPNIDAYFNWPGFFALLATVLRATGIDPVSVALWAPVLDVGLWLAALGVLARYLTSDPRRRWLVLWIFCLGNWQDQDYLSPQAFTFFLYLVVLVLLMGPLAAVPSKFPGFRPTVVVAWWRARSPAETRPGQRLGALALTLLLIPVICASHQLTPFMMLIAVTALSLSGRLWPGRLPLIAGVVLAFWLVYPASAYLAGHPPLANAGLQAATQANVVDHVNGTPGHLLVVQLRMAFTLIMWVLAAAGALRDWRRRRLDIRVVLLATTPLLLFPAQSYGGEMLIRISLFALPFVAFQACSALLPTSGTGRRLSPSGRGRRLSPGATGALAFTCLLLTVLNVIGRYGNAEFDVFTEGEVAAVAAAQRLAPPGSAMISAAHPTPWRNVAYLDHRYRTLDDMCRSRASSITCGQLVYDYARHNPAGGVVLITRSTEESLILRGLSDQRNFDQLEEWLSAQNGVDLAFSNSEARVYRVAP